MWYLKGCMNFNHWDSFLKKQWILFHCYVKMRYNLILIMKLYSLANILFYIVTLNILYYMLYFLYPIYYIYHRNTSWEWFWLVITILHHQQLELRTIICPKLFQMKLQTAKNNSFEAGVHDDDHWGLDLVNPGRK